MIDSGVQKGWGDGPWRRWTALVRGLGLDADHAAVAVLRDVVASAERSGAVRSDALNALFALGHSDRRELLQQGIADSDGEVRAAALAELAKEDAPQAIALLKLAIEGGEGSVRQAAVRALAGIDSKLVSPVIARLAGAEALAEEPSNIAVELIEAAAAQGGEVELEAVRALTPEVSELDALAPWRPALVGGDAEAGRVVFLEKTEVNCLRCHVAGDQGSSEVGPDLTGVGSRLDARALLESIVAPNTTLAEGYESWIFALDDGTLLVGRILEENADWVLVLDVDGNKFELTHPEIEARKRDVSSMPADLKDHLSLRELRDVVAYLQSLQAEPADER